MLDLENTYDPRAPFVEAIARMLEEADRQGVDRLAVLATLAGIVGKELEALYDTRTAADCLRLTAEQLERDAPATSRPKATHKAGRA